jgi:hypothetical protein
MGINMEKMLDHRMLQEQTWKLGKEAGRYRWIGSKQVGRGERWESVGVREQADGLF